MRTFLIIFILISFGESFAQSVDTLRLKAQGSFLISSLRSEEGTYRGPIKIQLVGASNVEIKAPQNSPKAFFTLSGSWLNQQSQAAASPVLNGFYGSRVLMLQDGIRLNTSALGSGSHAILNMIDPFNIERMEVLSHQGAAQYGTDAIGGLVHVFSKEPVFSKGFSQSATMYGRWMSSNMEWSTRFETELTNRRFVLRVGGSLRDIGDLRVGKGSVLENSGFGLWEGDAKLIWQAAAQHKIKLSYDRLRQHSIHDPFREDSEFYTQYRIDLRQRELAWLAWEWAGFKKRNIATLRLSWQRNEEQRSIQPASNLPFRNEFDTAQSLGLSWQLEKVLAPHWQTTTGVEGYYDLIGSGTQLDSFPAIASGALPNGASALQLGVFSIHRFVKGHFQLRGGLRYFIHQNNIPNSPIAETERRFEGLAGFATLSWMPRRGMLSKPVFLSYQSGFHAPNLADMGAVNDRDVGFGVPSAGLMTERSHTISGGTSLLILRNALSLSSFYTTLNNPIIQQQGIWRGDSTMMGQPIWVRTNGERARIWGATMAFGGYWYRLGLRGKIQATYAQGQTASGDQLRGIPPFNGRAEVSFDKIRHVMIYASWQFAAAQRRLSPIELSDISIAKEGTQSWNSLNLYATIYPGNRLLVHLGLYNILDEAYRLHGSSIDMPGRHVLLSLRYKLVKHKE
ncbi:MAG: TonB-dependent receptor [Bacteroidia bacterium]